MCSQPVNRKRKSFSQRYIRKLTLVFHMPVATFSTTRGCRPLKLRDIPLLALESGRECRLESADRLTLCSQPVNAKRRGCSQGYAQKHTPFFHRPVPRFCTSLSVNARGPMDQIPDDRCSTELSLNAPPTCQRLLHRVIARSSTGSPQLVHRLVNRLYMSIARICGGEAIQGSSA